MHGRTGSETYSNHKSGMKIVFFGTPYFAVPVLNRLVNEGYDVAAVVTAPDKPAGRGQQIQESDVKKAALSHSIPVLQPVSLKSEDFINQLKKIKADIHIVVAFRMLPESVWAMPALGTINLHASLLPDYRGAAPINYAIINGEKQTGLTTFRLKHEIDTGDILLQSFLDIDENETAGSLHDKMLIHGPDLIVKTLKGLEDGSIKAVPQINSSLKTAPKLSKETGLLRFKSMSAIQIDRLVRGLSPFPGTFGLLSDGNTELQFKVFSGKLSHNEVQPGKILSDGKTFLTVGTASGAYSILECQLPGKKRLPIVEFLRGFNLKSEHSFSE